MSTALNVPLCVTLVDIDVMTLMCVTKVFVSNTR